MKARQQLPEHKKKQQQKNPNLFDIEDAVTQNLGRLRETCFLSYGFMSAFRLPFPGKKGLLTPAKQPGKGSIALLSLNFQASSFHLPSLRLRVASSA